MNRLVKRWAFSGRSSQRPLYTPSFNKPVLYPLGGDIECFAPFKQSSRFPAVGQLFSYSAVVDLFGGCSPATVFRSIVSITVNSVYRVIQAGSFPHIFKKILKPAFTKPPITHCNPAAAVRFQIFVPTTALHALPSFIGWRTYHTMFSSWAAMFEIIHSLTLMATKFSRITREATNRLLAIKTRNVLRLHNA